MGKHIFPLALFSFSIATSVFSQLMQPYRFEQTVKILDQPFRPMSLKTEGLALIRDLNKYDQGKKMWQLDVLDTTLSKVWSRELFLDRTLILIAYEYIPNNLYLLFREGDRDYYNFQLLSVRLRERETHVNEIKFDVNYKLSHFAMTGSTAVFGGYLNTKPTVLLYDLSADHPKVLPDQFINNFSLLDIRTNQNESFNVLFVEDGTKNERLFVRTYDHDGMLLVETIIDVDPSLAILSGLTSSLKRNEMIIAGTYGIGLDKPPLGFFSIVLDPFAKQRINFTDFGSLEHFTDYLPSKKADKIKEQAKKEKTMGQMPTYNAYVVPVRLEEDSRGFYLLAELYEPGEYNANSYPYPSNPVSRSYTNTYPLPGRRPSNAFNNNLGFLKTYGAKMIQSIVVNLGANGIAKGNASLILDNIKQRDLRQVGDFMISNENFYLIYKNNDDLFYLKETGDQGEKPKLQQSKIKLLDSIDVLKKPDENVGGVRNWYDNNFLAWGYQKIKRPAPGLTQTRFAFFVNRIKIK